MGTLIFLIVPILSIALLFVKDTDKSRKNVTNILLILNGLLYLVPIFMAYSNTPAGESMWNENTGGGASLWLYLIIFPVTFIAFIVLLILKVIYSTKS
jgi:hypothetical protein